MSEAEARPTNFIRQIIDEDLATGKHTTVHTRFPPEPNGYLHIGHAKSICLNFGIAQDYQGQCNLRFDDTNPVKEDIEYVESIKNDVQWLGFHWSGDVCYSSDYFDQLHQYAVELINKGLAYVDELSPDEIREYRGTLKAPGKNSPYRDRSVEENLALFEKMRSGGFEEGKACLRAKIDMASPFIVMRDPVLYRIKFAEHHQTGNKWCIYPMYDFTHCISDALEGITHSLCTLEFQDNRRLYDWVLDNITIPVHPRQYEFSRLNLEYTVMSKRKLNLLVTDKHVEGWDDPRMPTLCAMRRRGYTPEAIKDFLTRAGVAKADSVVDSAMLEHCVREDLNAHCDRAMAVIDPVKVVSVCGHDTQSAITAVPSQLDSFAFLSSGTWSLLGVKTPKPITNTASRAANYSNEGGVGYNRYQKNIMGMWLVNELQKELCSGLGFAEIVNAAKESRCDALIDANAPEFLAPKSMKAAFDTATGGKLISIGDYFRCAYRSLAESYAKALAELEANTGKQYDKLYIVGGGAKNDLLNRLTAQATGKRVIALPIEATVLGNLKIQMEADL